MRIDMTNDLMLIVKLKVHIYGRNSFLSFALAIYRSFSPTFLSMLPGLCFGLSTSFTYKVTCDLEREADKIAL